MRLILRRRRGIDSRHPVRQPISSSHQEIRYLHPGLLDALFANDCIVHRSADLPSVLEFLPLTGLHGFRWINGRIIDLFADDFPRLVD